jgi:hypothetical protein
MVGILGAILGAALWFIAGLCAALSRNRWAWFAAVALGGGVPGALLVTLAIHTDGFLVPPTVIAIALMAAVCHGLISGRSHLPGVQQLAALAHDTNPSPASRRDESAPREMIPSGTPEGRGDEAAPAE